MSSCKETTHEHSLVAVETQRPAGRARAMPPGLSCPGILRREEGMTPRESVWPAEVEGKSLTRVRKPAVRAPLPQARGERCSLGTLPPPRYQVCSPAPGCWSPESQKGHGEVDRFSPIRFRWLLRPLLPCFKPFWHFKCSRPSCPWTHVVQFYSSNNSQKCSIS